MFKIIFDNLEIVSQVQILELLNQLLESRKELDPFRLAVYDGFVASIIKVLEDNNIDVLEQT